MNLRRLFSIVLKELRQLRRDRLTFGMIIGIPTMQLLLFGFAINLDVRHLDTAVLDQANTARSREFIAEIAASQVITLREQLSSPQQLDESMRQGKISVGIVIPADFDNRLERGDRAPLQLVVDGSDQVVQQAARQLAAYPLARLRGSDAAQAAGIEIVNFYNPERRAPVNTVPGLVGVILTMTMVMFTAMALVRERERGNLEMLIATPVSPWELTLGKVLPFIGIGLVQVSLVLALGKLIFAVPLRGSLLQIYLAALLFILASAALGVFLSTLARSQFQAMQMAFFTFLPQILLSGFMFPFAGMPGWAQFIGQGVPATHFLRVIRAVMLKGGDVADVALECGALAIILVVISSIAMLRYRQTLD